MQRITALMGASLLALLTAGCAGSQFGAAAVVGDQTISVSVIERAVTGLLQQRREFGEQDSGTVQSGEDARDMVRFHVLAEVMRQIAIARGITISEGEHRALKRQFEESTGGVDGLRLALTQNGIAEADLDLYLDVVLYQRKLGKLLVPGDSPDLQGAQNEAVDAEIKAYLAKDQVKVNPRFGKFDPTTGVILERDDTNGVVTLPAL